MVESAELAIGAWAVTALLVVAFFVVIGVGIYATESIRSRYGSRVVDMLSAIVIIGLVALAMRYG